MKEVPIRRALAAKARRRANLRQLIDSWWEAACSGDAQAREQILKRLDPILDDPQAGRQILTGLKLELQVGKGPVVGIRGVIGQAELPAGELRGSSEQGLLSEGGQRHAAPQISQESQSLPESQVPSSPDGAADPASGS